MRGMALHKKNADGSPLIWGGSQHRASDGRLCTLQTMARHVDPRGAQELWSRTSRQSYPPRWNGFEANAEVVVYWSEPIRFRCGHCGGGLGTYRAYEVTRERGVVENTAVIYSRADDPMVGIDPMTRVAGPNRPFRIDGEVAGRAARTTAYFNCRKCSRIFRRNLQRFGEELWAANATTYSFDEPAKQNRSRITPVSRALNGL